MAQGFYEILGVDQQASSAAIQAAFQDQLAELVRRLRAARRQGADVTILEGQERALQEAMSVLTDPSRRQRYDAYRRATRHGMPTAAEGMWDVAKDALVDPLALTVIDESSLLTIPGLTKNETLSPAGPATMAFRMLNNLKAYYMSLENRAAMLMTTEYQVGIVHDEPRLLGMVHFERGEYCQKLNDSEAALVEYARCAAVSPDSELARRANAKLDQLIGANQGRLH